MIIRNDSGQKKDVETVEIFKDGQYSSEFLSDSYGTFDWMNTKDERIFMDQIMIDGTIYWEGKVSYVKQKTFENYIKLGNSLKISLKPYESVAVRGEFTYLERICHYTFTIKNKNSGHVFHLTGTWKQKVPLTSHTILE